MGGIINAFATASSGDEPTAGDKVDPIALKTLDGVGMLGGIFECIDADKSSNAATGVVNGR